MGLPRPPSTRTAPPASLHSGDQLRKPAALRAYLLAARQWEERVHDGGASNSGRGQRTQVLLLSDATRTFSRSQLNTGLHCPKLAVRCVKITRTQSKNVLILSANNGKFQLWPKAITHICEQSTTRNAVTTICEQARNFENGGVCRLLEPILMESVWSLYQSGNPDEILTNTRGEGKM